MIIGLLGDYNLCVKFRDQLDLHNKIICADPQISKKFGAELVKAKNYAARQELVVRQSDFLYICWNKSLKDLVCPAIKLATFLRKEFKVISEMNISVTTIIAIVMYSMMDGDVPTDFLGAKNSFENLKPTDQDYWKDIATGFIETLNSNDIVILYKNMAQNICAAAKFLEKQTT